MRVFLQEYRPNIVGLLKRHNGVNGNVSSESKKVLDKIVDAYVALMSMTDFVEVSLLLLRTSDSLLTFPVRRGKYVGRQVKWFHIGIYSSNSMDMQEPDE
jgi:hypothetical protein